MSKSAFACESGFEFKVESLEVRGWISRLLNFLNLSNLSYTISQISVAEVALITRTFTRSPTFA